MTDDSDHLFGAVAIKHKFMTAQQVNECLDIQARMQTYGLKEKKIGEIALERCFLTERQLRLLLNIQSAEMEEYHKQEAVRPRPAPAPASKPAAPARPQAPVRLPADHLPQAPAARSRISEYTTQARMRQIGTVLVLCLLGIIVVIILVNLKDPGTGGNNTQTRTPRNAGSASRVTRANAAIAREHERISEEREREAEKLYQELKQWAEKNRERKEEIIKRANRIAIDYAETAAARAARLLADFYADLPETTAQAATGRQIDAQASQLYMKLSMEALKLRSKDRWAKAIEVYQQFPEEFKDTRWYHKVQSEIRRLRQKIAQKYEADLRTINRLIGARKYGEARQYLTKIENYASHDLVIAVQRELDSYIETVRKKPTPAPVSRSQEAILAEKLRVAEKMFWRNMYEEAIETYRELAQDPGFVSSHPRIRDRVKDLERIISVLDAAAKDILKSKGRKRTIHLEKEGSMRVRILDVSDRVITAYERGSGSFEIPVSRIKTSVLLLSAKKHLPARDPETDMALGTFLMSLGDLKAAERHFFNAVKHGASNDEIARLLTRLKEKPPATAEEEPVVAKKDESKDTADASKLLADAAKSFGRGDYAKARSLYKKLLRCFPNSSVVANNSDRITRNLASCEENLTSPLSRLFSGRVLQCRDLGKNVIEVTYDFASERQLGDWREYNWYSIFDMHDSNWHLADGELSGNGSRGFLWKGIINGDVKVEFDAYSTSGTRQNIQATICDDGDGSNYLFAAGLTELGDPKDIIRRNEKFSFGKEIARHTSEAKSFKKYHIKIIRKGSEMSFYVDDELILKARHTLYKGGHVGLFAIGSTVRYDNLTITGRLDRRWLAKQKSR